MRFHLEQLHFSPRPRARDSHSTLISSTQAVDWIVQPPRCAKKLPGIAQALSMRSTGIFRELERGRAGTDQASFDLWRQEFNTERPHEALGMAMPAEVYRPSTRAFEGTPEAIDYGPMETRKVTRQGTIGYGGDHVIISTALRHWNVGLSPRDDGLVDVWFAKLLVGHIDPKEAAFHPTSPPKKSHPSRGGAASFWPSPLRSEGQNDAPLTAQPKPKKL